MLGTAAYLSPEQARGHPATAASDRYSLAVVAYELLCGRRPFEGETPVAQARAHAEVEPPTPTALPGRGRRAQARSRPRTRPSVREPRRPSSRRSNRSWATRAADRAPRSSQTPRADRTGVGLRVALRALRRRPAEPPRAPRAAAPAAADPVARERPGGRGVDVDGLAAVAARAAPAGTALIGANGNAGDGGQPHVRSSSRQADLRLPAEAGGAEAEGRPRQRQDGGRAPAPGAEPTSTPAPATPRRPPPPTPAVPRPAQQRRFRDAARRSTGALPLLQRAVDGSGPGRPQQPTTPTRSTTTAGPCAWPAGPPRRSRTCRSACRSATTSAASSRRSWRPPSSWRARRPRARSKKPKKSED